MSDASEIVERYHRYASDRVDGFKAQLQDARDLANKAMDTKATARELVADFVKLGIASFDNAFGWMCPTPIRSTRQAARKQGQSDPPSKSHETKSSG